MPELKLKLDRTVCLQAARTIHSSIFLSSCQSMIGAGSMGSNMGQGGFQMQEDQRRNREISRRETEIMRAEAVQLEMASAVRVLGGEGSAKEQITRAARAAGLSPTVVERLRWKKTKIVPAHIADSVREAMARHKEEGLSRAEHEVFLAQHQAAILRARLMEVDPAFAGSFVGLDRWAGSGVGRSAD